MVILKEGRTLYKVLMENGNQQDNRRDKFAFYVENRILFGVYMLAGQV